MTYIMEFYTKGGPFMHFILVCLLIGIGFMFERFIFLFFKYNINGAALMAHIQKLVLAGQIERAIAVCNGHQSAALSTVIKAGL